MCQITSRIQELSHDRIPCAFAQTLDDKMNAIIRPGLLDVFHVIRLDSAVQWLLLMKRKEKNA
jgi:hypothetical protein